MKSPHVYLSDGFLIKGTPISKEELEKETNSKTPFRDESTVFLRDVTITGSSGSQLDVQYFVLYGNRVSGVGRDLVQTGSILNKVA